MKLTPMMVLAHGARAALGLALASCAVNEPERRAPEPVPPATSATAEPVAAVPATASAPAGGQRRARNRVTPARAARTADSASAPARDAARVPTPSPSASMQSPGQDLHVSAQRAWPEPWKECVGIHVYIVSLSPGHPEQSAASISTTPKGRARVVRPGQWIGEWEVLAITDDWTGTRPGVWLRRDAEICRARLSGSEDRTVTEPPRRKRTKKRRAR